MTRPVETRCSSGAPPPTTGQTAERGLSCPISNSSDGKAGGTSQPVPRLEGE